MAGRLTRKQQAADVARQERKARVASLRARCMSSYKIEQALADEGMKNPDTGESWDASTIKRDIEELLRDWQDAARVDTRIHVAKQLAELDEVKQSAWSKLKGDKALAIVIRALEREAKLLGLDASIKLSVDGTINDPLLARYAGMTLDELREIAAKRGG